MCNSIESIFGQVAILIGSQRNSFPAVAHCLSETSFRGATVKEIPLTQGKHRGKVALVDDEDFELVSQFKWRARKDGYVWYATSGRKWMHRLVMNAPLGIHVDHRNGNGLDNRRSVNLRFADQSVNQQNRHHQKNNTSGYKNVSMHKATGKWRAQICCKRQRTHLGLYSTKNEAALAYNRKAKELFGVDAWQIKIEEG
jgi:hypothetical protein